MTIAYELKPQPYKNPDYKPTPITLKKVLERTTKLTPTLTTPKDLDEIVLLQRQYFEDNDDLILGRTNKSRAALYKGRWNDGTVE